jgi:acyl-CoA reductase-like NAD-dependent aldehyde dehydrogenase
VPLLTLEQGKPIGEARDEIAEAAAMLRRVAEDARRLADAPPPVVDLNKRVLLIREPLGVVASITPWNFPYVIPLEHVAPALAMGNAVILKPAETTSLAALELGDALLEAGWPEGAIACLPGAGDIGAALVSHADVDAVCFTGSTSTGSAVARAAAGKELVLELGGNGPTIVFADADLARAASAIASACFYCAGQSCAATGRVLVERRVAAQFAELLSARATAVRFGDPRDDETTLGPLNNQQLLEKINRQIEEALGAGASLLVGGRPAKDQPTGLYYPVTVIADVPPDCELFVEETFGPIAVLAPFDDERDALELAERSSYGLSASVWTRDLARAFRVAEALPNGNVAVNDHSNYWEAALPFGGAPRRCSGIGRVGGDEILRRLSTVRTISVDVS